MGFERRSVPVVPPLCRIYRHRADNALGLVLETPVREKEKAKRKGRHGTGVKGRQSTVLINVRNTPTHRHPQHPDADNLELKALLLEGFFRNVLTTNTTPAHSGPQLNSSLVDARVHVMTVADMGVLAGARAIVADRFGGFGLQARLWGGVTLAETPDTETRFVATPDCINRERILDKHLAGVKT